MCCTITWEGTETLTWPRTPFGGRPKLIVIEEDKNGNRIIENVDSFVLEHYIEPGDTPTSIELSMVEAELQHAEQITSRLTRWTILLVGLGVLYVANYLLILMLTRVSRYLVH